MRSAPAICPRSPATRASPASKSRSAASNRRRGLRPPSRAKGRAASPADLLNLYRQGSMNQHMRPEPVPFIDIAAQRQRLGSAIDVATKRVLDHCQFISGPEVTQLETMLAGYCGAKHVITCANGTDALVMVLMAIGVGRGDAVFCPSFTFCATASPVARAGATPLFVDVDETTFNMTRASLERGIATARKLGLKPRVVIPVDLFGQSADHDSIGELARAEGLFVLDDAAQAFGATYHGRRLGTLADATTTSFFPAKPLGCYGDGGAIFTDDDNLANTLRSIRFHGRRLGTLADATTTSFFPAKPLGCYGDGGAIFTDDDNLANTLRSIRVHGQGSDKYDNIRLGMTGRLDTIQAAVLIEKLKIFDD